MNSLQAKKLLTSYVSMQSSQFMGSVWESSNHWNADFIAVKWGGMITEFEIKLSRQDLRGEVMAVKKATDKDVMEQYELWGRQHQRIRRDINLSHSKIQKHRHYLVERAKDPFAHHDRQLFRPNHFYFAVPDGLVDYAKELTKGLPYGVFNLNKTSAVRRATRLHDDSHSPRVMLDLFSRACTLRLDVDIYTLSYVRNLTEYLAKEYGHDVGSIGWMRLHEKVKQFNKQEGL